MVRLVAPEAAEVDAALVRIMEEQAVSMLAPVADSLPTKVMQDGAAAEAAVQVQRLAILAVTATAAAAEEAENPQEAPAATATQP